MGDEPLFGGIELGGTKVIAAVGRADGMIVSSRTLPTTDPVQLVEQLADFFKAQPQRISGLGVGAFGPVVLDPAATNYGRLLETNKPGWSGFDLVGALSKRVGVPVRLLTDVAVAGLGEAHFGALRGIDLGVYLTVGTGIGGAILCHGAPLPAMLHPEMGHLTLDRQEGDGVASTCRFHQNCAEGLAAGPAIMARFGRSLSECCPGGTEQQLIADYLGQLCAHLVLLLSPQRIIIGGGVGQTVGLIGATHQAMLSRLGGYATDGVINPDYICAPDLGQNAGVVGALICAQSAAERS
ncbi:MAG: hypothetical protein RLZZ561_211 [Pseudomonadota bacterium]|jgi:fructokinase